MAPEEAPICLPSSQGVHKAGKTCSFQHIREMYQEEKNGDVQPLQRSNAPSTYAGRKQL